MILFGTAPRRIQRLPARKVIKIRNRNKVVATYELKDLLRATKQLRTPVLPPALPAPATEDSYEKESKAKIPSSSQARTDADAPVKKEPKTSKKDGTPVKRSFIPIPADKNAVLKKKTANGNPKPTSKTTPVQPKEPPETKRPIFSFPKKKVGIARPGAKEAPTNTIPRRATKSPEPPIKKPSERTDTLDTVSTLPRQNTLTSQPPEDSDQTPMTSPEMRPSTPPIAVEDIPHLENQWALTRIPQNAGGSHGSQANSIYSSSASSSSTSLPLPDTGLARLPIRPPTPPNTWEDVREHFKKEYGVRLYRPRYVGQKAKSLDALLKREMRMNARQLYYMLHKRDKNNIILHADDPSLKLPVIAALQEKIGYKIPVLDYDEMDDTEAYAPKLYKLIIRHYQALREEAKVPAKAPLVLYLKNVNAHTLNSFATERNLKRHLFNADRKVRLILDATPEMLPFTDVIRRSKRFDEYEIQSLKPLEWNVKLGRSLERERLERKWHYTLSQAQLNRVLFLLLREKGGPPSRSYILQTLDSLGAFLKARESSSKRGDMIMRSMPASLKAKMQNRSVKLIDDEALLAFFRHKDLMRPANETNRTKFSFELQNDLSQLVGLDAGKDILDILKAHAAHPLLSEKILGGRPLVTNLLLYGPPGVGKTMYAEGAAKELEKMTDTPVTFIRRKGSDFSAKQRYGESAKEVRRFMDDIKHAPTPMVVAFVDEASSIYNRKNGDTSNATVATDMMSATDELLIALEDLKKTTDKTVLVVFATNILENLDSALKNRMDYKLKVDIPDNLERRKILSNKMTAANLVSDEETLRYALQVAEKAKYSARELDSFVRRMQNNAFKNLAGKGDLTQALRRDLEKVILLKLTKQDIDQAEALGREEKSEEAAHKELKESYEKRKLIQDVRELNLQEAIPDEEMARNSQTHRREMTQRNRAVTLDESVPDTVHQRRRLLELRKLGLDEKAIELEEGISDGERKTDLQLRRRQRILQDKALLREESVPDTEHARRRALETQKLGLEEKAVKREQDISEGEHQEDLQLRRRQRKLQAKATTREEAIPDTEHDRRRQLQEKELDLQERNTNQAHNILIEELKPSTYGIQ